MGGGGDIISEGRDTFPAKGVVRTLSRPRLMHSLVTVIIAHSASDASQTLPRVRELQGEAQIGGLCEREAKVLVGGRRSERLIVSCRSMDVR